MGLTFKKQDELEKLFDKFATVPDDKKKKVAKNKDKIVKDKDNKSVWEKNNSQITKDDQFNS